MIGVTSTSECVPSSSPLGTCVRSTESVENEQENTVEGEEESVDVLRRHVQSRERIDGGNENEHPGDSKEEVENGCDCYVTELTAGSFLVR